MAAVIHVVLVRWRAEAGDDAREAVRAGVRGLATAVPGVLGIEEGPSVSPEGLEQGNDYGFVVTFVDAAARDAYLPHPVHLEVADAIGRGAERVTVFDVAAR
ncbi:MAG TPA: Dabb family protein [Amnibacterium sp.]|jgi:hypothetical protein|nr:Dabb family protein [Amnibacterium sp.]